MLVTIWPSTRSLPSRKFFSGGKHIRQAFHNTSHQRAKTPTVIIQPLYIDTAPPSAAQLGASEVFFKTHLPTKSWTAAEWRQQPHTESTYLVPEVAFLGRSNSGKSSLLNGLLFDDQLCRVGAKPGKTITMHAWSLSPIDPKTRGARKGYKGDTDPKLSVLDMPGYGHGSHGDWGKDIMKYLTARRQLRRAFVLVNPIHGLKEQDLQMLELLRGHGIPHQLIACKADMIKPREAPQMLSDLQVQIDTYFAKRRQIPLLMTIKDILTVGGLAQHKDRTKWLDSAQGLHDIRWAILRAAGLEEYAMTLAANGGKIPKTKSPGIQSVQSISDHSSPSMQEATNIDPQPYADRHVAPAAHVAGESVGHLGTLLETQFTPQSTPSIGISASELLSERVAPGTRSMGHGPTRGNDKADFSIDEFMAEIMPVRGQTATPRKSGQDGRRQERAGMMGSRRSAAQTTRPSRIKDVKRYNGGRR